MEMYAPAHPPQEDDQPAPIPCAVHHELRGMVAFCPAFHHAMELIGRRWTGVILRAMLAGVTQFSQLREAIPGLSDRMLSERLKELEAEGIVTRTVIPATPVRVVYALTDKGRALNDVLRVVADWAETWHAAPSTGATCAGNDAHPTGSGGL